MAVTADRSRAKDRPTETAPFSARALDGVDTVVIDLGDTLIPLGQARNTATKIYYDALARESGLDKVTLADGLRHPRNQELLALPFGLNSHPGLTAAFPDQDLVQKFAPLGLQMRRTFGDLVAADRPTVAFLERLKEQGRKVVVMTALPESAARYALRESGLTNLVHHTYPGQDIEQEAPGGANSRRLNQVLGGGTEAPMTAIPAGLNMREKLQFVMAAEGAKADSSLRIADHVRRDLGPAKSLGLRTAHITAHWGASDADLAREMHRLRRGSGQVEPLQILPMTPRYEPSAGDMVPDFEIKKTTQLAAAVSPTQAPGKSTAAAAQAPAPRRIAQPVGAL
ncbi:MAG: HAD family hydrolase [Alphaproteobacteria bacterium]|nr:HAD family hydrolase [Alphaproteobacteria bacterium SS10]